MNRDMWKSKFEEPYITALDLMIQSVYKPDHELRLEAKSNKCIEELLSVREEVLEFLHSRRNEFLS